MAFTVKVISTAIKSAGDATGEEAHQTAVKTYLDAASITTVHDISTFWMGGYLVTIIVFE